MNSALISWIQKLNPEATRDKWSFNENRDLFELYREKRNHWKEISKGLNSRTDNAAKNQFFALIRKGLRKACRSIGLTNNTAKINKIKPKVLLDFFESTYNVEGTTFNKTIVISEFIEYYALTDRPPCGIYDANKREIITQLMNSLEQSNKRYEQLKQGDVSNADESNRFFKRPQRNKEGNGTFEGLQIDVSHSLPANNSDGSIESPAEKQKVATECPLGKAMLEENKFKYQPNQMPHEGESVDPAMEANWGGPADTIPGSPGYDKPEESFNSDYNDVLGHALGNNSIADKEGKHSGSSSPKSRPYQRIANIYRNSVFGQLNNNFDTYENMNILTLPFRNNGITSDDLQRRNFTLNVINIDDQIAVPSVTNKGEVESRQFLFSGTASEKNSKKEFK